MVALQFLVLSVEVRILVRQRKKVENLLLIYRLARGFFVLVRKLDRNESFGKVALWE